MYETWALFTIDAYNRFGGIKTQPLRGKTRIPIYEEK